MGKDKDQKDNKKEKKDKKEKKNKEEKLTGKSFPPASQTTCQQACDNYARLLAPPSVLRDVVPQSSSRSPTELDHQQFVKNCPTRCQSQYNEFQAYCISRATSQSQADRCLLYTTNMLNNLEKSERKEMKSELKSYAKYLKKREKENKE